MWTPLITLCVFACILVLFTFVHVCVCRAGPPLQKPLREVSPSSVLHHPHHSTPSLPPSLPTSSTTQLSSPHRLLPLLRGLPLSRRPFLQLLLLLIYPRLPLSPLYHLRYNSSSLVNLQPGRIQTVCCCCVKMMMFHSNWVIVKIWGQNIDHACQWQ